MSRAEQLIYQRRAQQQKLSAMQTKLKQQFHQQEFAKWQNKGKNLEIQNQLRSRLNQARAQSQANLNFRRQKLSLLLQQENSAYQKQIIDSQETPEQIRQKMAQRVQQLKAEKQTRRQDEVNARLDKRFLMNADELRKVDQELKELRTAYERNIQMVERQNLLENQYQQQVLFAELNRRDIKKKQQAERAKQQQRKEKVNERNAILAIQKQMKQRKAEQEKSLTAKQKQMLRYQWQRQTQLQKMKQRQVIQKKKQVNSGIIESNQRLKREKQQQLRLQKLQDREMIERIVAKQRQLAEYQKYMREQQKQEAKRTLQGMKNRSGEMAAYERQLDRLINQQRLKKQRKADDEWQKKQKARINLLHQVFEDRQKKLRQHASERDGEIQVKMQQKYDVQRKTKQYEAELERKRQIQLEKSKAEQRKLLEQITSKQQRRRMILQELHRQQQNLQAGRQEYERKIQDRKMQGRQELEGFKKTHRLY